VPTFPTFRFVSSYRPIPDALTLRWALNPHDWPLSDLAFVIFRSETPQGPWEDVGSVLHAQTVMRSYYHIIRCLSKTERKYVDSSWVDSKPEQDHIGTELIRKKMVYLMARGGCQAAMMAKKTWGATCSRCYNYEKMAATDPDCPNCFGTGFTGGYLKPVYLPALINPPQKSIVAAQIVFVPGQIYAEIGYMPIVNPDDVFTDVRQNIRYKVKTVSPYTHRLVTVSQTLLLIRIDENDNLYSISIPEINPNSYAGRAWDLVQPRNPSWMNRNVGDYKFENKTP